MLELVGQGADDGARTAVGHVPGRTFRNRIESRVHEEDQPLGRDTEICVSGNSQEIVHGPEVPDDSAFTGLRGAVAFDIEQQDVYLAGGPWRNQVRVAVRTPRTPEYRRDPVVDVVAGAGAEERFRHPVHHFCGHARPGACAVRPPVPVRHPERRGRGAVGDHPAGGRRDVDDAAVVEIGEGEPVAFRDCSLRTLRPRVQSRLRAGRPARQRRVVVELRDPLALR